jgi:hypothetical protein
MVGFLEWLPLAALTSSACMPRVTGFRSTGIFIAPAPAPPPPAAILAAASSSIKVRVKARTPAVRAFRRSKEADG